MARPKTYQKRGQKPDRTRNPEIKAIGEALKQRRETLDLNQAEVAKIAGVSIGTVSEIERGEKDPLWSTLQKIVSALHTSYHEIEREAIRRLAEKKCLIPVDAEQRECANDVTRHKGGTIWETNF